MARGWRTTARMMATAAAAAAVSRAAESMRRLVEEAGRPELDGPVSTPEPLRFLEAPSPLTTAGPPAPRRTEEPIIAAQVTPPHEFGPTPVVVPSRGIGFRSSQPVAEMPIIYRPANREPDRPRPVEPVPPPPPVHTAASIIEDHDEDPEIDDDDLADEVDAEDLADEVALAGDPAPATAEDPVASAADQTGVDEADVADDASYGFPRLVAPPVEDTPVAEEDAAPADLVIGFPAETEPVEVELDAADPDETDPAETDPAETDLDEARETVPDEAETTAEQTDAEPTDTEPTDAELTDAEPTDETVDEAADPAVALAEQRARQQAKAEAKAAKKAKRRAKELAAQEAAAEEAAAAEELAAATTAQPTVVEEPHVEIIVAEHFVDDPVTQEFVTDAPAPVATADPVAAPTAVTASDAAPRDPAKHRRDRSAVSGTVTSSRGRGLSGVTLEVFDTAEQLVSATMSGSGGWFILEDLPAGVYRLRASDPDGDFATQWLGGSSFDMASPLRVKDRKTRRRTDVRLVSTPAVDVSVDSRTKKTVVGISVTERGTGVAATGAVRVSTKAFSAELPLVDGHSSITLIGRTTGKRAIAKKVTVTYRGDRHTASGSQTTRLR